MEEPKECTHKKSAYGCMELLVIDPMQWKLLAKAIENHDSPLPSHPTAAHIYYFSFESSMIKHAPIFFSAPSLMEAIMKRHI